MHEATCTDTIYFSICLIGVPGVSATGRGHQSRVTERGIAMTKMKFKKQERLTRAEAAARLTEIAKALRNSADFELERDGEKLELDVSENVTLEFEIEIEDGQTELEVEIKWASVTSQGTSTGPASTS